MSTAANETVSTVVIIHCTQPWQDANYREAYAALAGQLPASAAVVCVDRPVDCAVAPVKRTGVFLTGAFRTGMQRISDRLLVVRPWLIVHELIAEKLPGVRGLNAMLLNRQIRTGIRRCFPRASAMINWVYYPHQRWVWGALPGARRVYQCYDEYACSPDGEFHADRWERERQVLREAELTFVTSEELAEPRRPETRRLTIFPNGIPAHFLDDVALGTDAVDDIPSPRFCYVGQSYDFIQYDMLHEVFTRRPQWQLVFIGNKRQIPGVRRLENLPNVHFVGRRPHADLPRLLPRFDAALLPVVSNRYTAGGTFLKLYAYMAAGVPIVATALPGLSSLHELLIIAADGAAGYEAALECALGSNRDETRTRLRRAVQTHTWDVICRDHVVPALRESFTF